MDIVRGGQISRKSFLAGGVGVAAAPYLAGLQSGDASAETAESDRPPVDDYPLVKAGLWVRGPNLKDSAGNFQARQEHAAAVLDGFVYLIGGFVPIRPAPEPTANNPEPFPFAGTGEMIVYTPSDRPAVGSARPGRWVTLPAGSSFPHADAHHVMAATHLGRIWAFGGHSGPFSPTDAVFVFTPDGKNTPDGTWSAVRRSDGTACRANDPGRLRLPSRRAAGAAVSVGNRIYVLGGVVPFPASPDPVNQAIRTTDSVIYLDTKRFPLTWRRAPSMRERREHFNVVFADGRLWVFQGRNERTTHMRGVESLAPAVPVWRREQDAPVGAGANVLARIGRRVYSFGGEFIASNITGTLTSSQFFDLDSRSWSRLQTRKRAEPLDASGADSKHGTYGAVIVEDGKHKLMSPGGAATAWFDPMSKVHVFLPHG